ncbi:hypothetical protein H6G41_30765 [Tolypothrix sp. FACHB-123]|uniref:hypothetical protein n=1 Tax=Tolypothrix sp. FACHB-123 TaxID=2692868 RepID=UPI001689A37D|nr:hypothetical protein [Tolypothrix sp. FACHB-123]MBD2358931.1 hypothetical protein [Tolypothrix sp. FACHB-123]
MRQQERALFSSLGFSCWIAIALSNLPKQERFLTEPTASNDTHAPLLVRNPGLHRNDATE